VEEIRYEAKWFENRLSDRATRKRRAASAHVASQGAHADAVHLRDISNLE
jgi:hypothetical protein